MPLNSVLIKDGHQESAEAFFDLPELEQFLNSNHGEACLLYTSPSPRDRQKSRMPSSA